MNFEHESWRPLFLREPVDQRAWNLVTRGLRVYLIRMAEEDGTLLKRCSDPFEVAASLGVHSEESALVRGAIDTLMRDGFLRWEGDPDQPGWLGVDRLVTFAAAPVGAGPEPNGPAEGETASDRRRRLARERKRRSRGRSEPRSVTEERDTDPVTPVTNERDMPPVTSVTSLPRPLPRTYKQREKERAIPERARVTHRVTWGA